MNGTHRRRSAGRGRRSVLSASEVILLAIALGVLVALAAAPAIRAPHIERVTTVRVNASETLWQIAESHRAPGRGTRETIDAIRTLNGLSGSDIVAGQVLTVPDAGGTAVASR